MEWSCKRIFQLRKLAKWSVNRLFYLAILVEQCGLIAKAYKYATLCSKSSDTKII